MVTTLSLSTDQVRAPSQDRVLIDVIVENERGVPVEGLTQTDFDITSRGTVRAIESFDVNTPFSVLIVLDRSASVSMRELHGQIDKELGDLIHWLADQTLGSSRTRVASLTNRLHMMPAFVEDRASLLAGAERVVAVPSADRVGPTPIVDAIAAAIDVLSTETGRRAIVLVTDGRSSGNHMSAAEVQHRATASGIAVNVVLVPASAARMLNTLHRDVAAAMHPQRLLHPIAAASGGDLLVVKESIPPEPRRSLERIFARLRRTYTVGIASPGAPDGRFHDLDVKVKRPGLRVLTRAGFESR